MTKTEDEVYFEGMVGGSRRMGKGDAEIVTGHMLCEEHFEGAETEGKHNVRDCPLCLCENVAFK